MDYIGTVQTIVELNEYLKRAERLLTAEDRTDIVSHLSFHPRAGALIRSAGGIRKLRWKREGSGKSGGVRIIYYYHDDTIPLYLLTVFAKNERANVSRAERNELAKLSALLLQQARRRWRRD